MLPHILMLLDFAAGLASEAPTKKNTGMLSSLNIRRIMHSNRRLRRRV